LARKNVIICDFCKKEYSIDMANDIKDFDILIEKLSYNMELCDNCAKNVLKKFQALIKWIRNPEGASVTI